MGQLTFARVTVGGFLFRHATAEMALGLTVLIGRLGTDAARLGALVWKGEELPRLVAVLAPQFGAGWARNHPLGPFILILVRPTHKLGFKLAMAGFFDACLAPGTQTIQVHQNTVARREQVLPPSVDFEDCLVEVDPGVALTLNQVRIDVVGDERLAFEGGDPTATITIRNSIIRACDTDIFGFGNLTILRSSILDPNTTCDVKEFFADGDIAITGSVLRTENPEADSDIVIDSSDGKVAIVRSELRAADDLRIEGPSGVTLILNRLRAQQRLHGHEYRPARG